MKTLTIRDFRTRPRQAREALAREREALLTVNGEPVAVMLAIDDGLDEAVALIERVRAQRAVRELRAAARRSGADRLSTAALARLIGDVRRSRARRRPAR
jgi:hypothetical protein